MPANRLKHWIKGGALLTVNEEERSAVFVLSTNDLDRDGETVQVENIDLSDFRRNPVVVLNHQTDELPIAASWKRPGAPVEVWLDDVEIDGQRRRALLGRAYFSKANPQGELAWQMVREGTLNAASVSFLPLGRPEKNAYGGNHWAQSRLLEWSICPLGSNPHALALAYRRLKSAGAGAAEAEDDLPPTLVEDSLRQVIAEMSWMRDHSEGLDDEQRARLNDCIARLEQALAEHPDYRPGMQNAKAFRPGGAELSARAKALVGQLNAVDEAFLANPEAPSELKRITRAFRAKRVELWGDDDDDLTDEERAELVQALAELKANEQRLLHTFYQMSGRWLGEDGQRNGHGGLR